MKKIIEALYDIINLLFRPNRLAEKGAQKSYEIDLTHNSQFKESVAKQQQGGKENEEYMKNAYRWNKEAIDKVRRSYFSSLCLVLASILLSWGTAQMLCTFVGSPSRALIDTMQIASGAILLWATIGIAGWEIQTTRGTTLPEHMNRFIFRALYCIGTYFLALSLLWQ